MRRAAAAFAAAVLACACAGHAPAGAPPSAPRIVSLAPSLTEIAYAIGCGPQLVGDTLYDDYPEAARRLPHVADLTHVDLERLSQLAPTAILALHDQESEGSAISRVMRGAGVQYLPNRNLADLYTDVAGVGHACGRDRQAQAFDAQMRRSIGRIAGQAARARTRPRVLYLLGLPGFTAGRQSYLSDLIALAGGINVAGNVDQPYPNLSAEAIVAMDPDVLIVARDTPFGPDVRAREPWRSMRAVHDGEVFSPPNDDVLERPGPRVVQGLAWLAHALHSRD